MDYRSGTDGDFINIETFVWQAIFPAFHHPDLTEAQQEENDGIVEKAREACLEAVALHQKEVIIARDPKMKRLAGFIILDRGPSTYPEIVWLIVSRRYWGQGVADQLIRRGIDWLGHHKPIQLGVNYYLERAIAFFEKYGFENTGEPAGDQLIPRILMLREAGPLLPLEKPPAEQLSIPIEQDPEITVVHNPLEPDSEVLEPKDPQVELFPPAEETEVAEVTNTIKAEAAPAEPEVDQDMAEKEDVATSQAPEKPTPKKEAFRSRYQDIELEIDYGEAAPPETPPTPAPPTTGIAFEFAFEEAEIPAEADEKLELPDLEEATATPPPPTELPPLADAEPEQPTVTLTDLRRGFQDHFMQMVTDLFGNRAAADYWQELQVSGFREIADNSLRQLLEQGKSPDDQLLRLSGDLTEYFIVETAAALNRHIFPQKLLRHQTKSAGNKELFTMVTDYLDFASENERVDTDFITISPKRLRNATKHFLLAGPGERIYCLVDQSMMGNLKNGFAFTDAALYWKTLLQPNHVAYFNEIKSVKLEQGALSINGHFFDTGSKSLNFKIALLLKKLGRISLTKH